MKSCWQADLQPDQSLSILGLGSLTLQTVKPHPHPFLTNGSKGWPDALQLVSQEVGVGEGGPPAMLPASGQMEWAALEQDWTSSKIRDVPSPPPPPTHQEEITRSKLFLPMETPYYCCLCCFLFCSGQFYQVSRVSKAGNVSSVKGHCTGFYVRLWSSTVSSDMLLRAKPAELCFVQKKIAHCTAGIMYWYFIKCSF